MRHAVVDIGTNTALLLLVEARVGRLRVLHDLSRIVRLGEGVDRTGKLAPAAIERTISTLCGFGALIRSHRASGRAVATQTLREVDNGAEFLERASVSLGLPIEIISGEREAELSFRAVAEGLPELRGDVLVLDVGGGSTELVSGFLGEEFLGRPRNDSTAAHLAWRRAREKRTTPPQIHWRRSLPVGSVRLSERHLRSDPPTDKEWAALCADVDKTLAWLPAEARPGARLIGVGGTVTTLAAVCQSLDVYDPASVQGLDLSGSEIASQIAWYRELPLARRRLIPGLSPGRADVILGGAAVVAGALHAVGAREIKVCDHGIRWGLLRELLQAADAARKPVRSKPVRSKPVRRKPVRSKPL